MSKLLASRLADELWMLAVSFLHIRSVLPRLPRVNKYFNNVVVWGPTSGALMWREAECMNTRVFKRWSGELNPSQTALIRACNQGAPLAHVSNLIVGGANVAMRAVDGDGCTALRWASKRGHEDIVRKLLEANADPNVADNDGWTPLMRASFFGHSAVVATLVAEGANVNYACRNGWTALMWASTFNYVDVVRVLVNARADINLRNNGGRTALDFARCDDRHDIIRILESAMSER